MSMQKITTQSQDKTSKYDGIEEALDVSSEIVPETKPEPIVPVEDPTSTRDQLKKDYEYTRGNLYSLIEKGQENYRLEYSQNIVVDKYMKLFKKICS